MKVLVVDDEPDVIEVVKLCFGLRWPEARVIAASNGEAAYKLIEEEAPEGFEAIPSPGRSGFSLTRDASMR